MKLVVFREWRELQDVACVCFSKHNKTSDGTRRQSFQAERYLAVLVSSKNLDTLAIARRDVVLQPIPAAAPGSLRTPVPALTDERLLERTPPSSLSRIRPQGFLEHRDRNV